MILFEAWALAFFVWLYFILVVSFKTARDNGELKNPIVQFHAGIVLASGVVFYVLLNLTLGSVVFLDPPREWQFTKRCRRYISGGSQVLTWEWLMRYRAAFAEWLCRNWLDPFEPGGHC